MKEETYPFVENGNKLLVFNSTTHEYEEYEGTIPGLFLSGSAINSEIRLDDLSVLHDVHIEINGDNHRIHVGSNKDSDPGKSCGIKTSYWFLGYNNCSLEIGNDIGIQSGTSISLVEPYARCKIGNHRRMAAGVNIYASDAHPIIDIRTRQVLNFGGGERALVIGDRCWLGLNSMILKNAFLADYTIVGAGSVVTKKFSEPNTIVAGNPARVVRTNVERIDLWTEVNLSKDEKK